MLSLDGCRKYLEEEDAAVSDEELAEKRDSMYQLARLLLSALPVPGHTSEAPVVSDHFEEILRSLSPAKQGALKDRAAFLVAEVGLPPDEAERVAITEYIKEQEN